MSNMSTPITRGYKQQVADHHKQCHILQSNRTDKHKINRILGLTNSNRYYNGQYRSRCPQQIRTEQELAEIREQIERKQIEQASTNTPKDIQPTKMPYRVKSQEQLSEPIHPKHIEQQMENICMQEHIGKQRPRLIQKLRYPSRKLEPM